jgi:CHAT domain-containing protein/tetratricopeptide (TPR) repeat protein
VGKEWDVAINLHNIAWVHANLGDRVRARSIYLEALEILRKRQVKPDTANTLSNLGETERELGNYQKALEYHNEALALRRQVGDRDGEAGSLNSLGKVYGKLGQNEKAHDHFESAIAILRTTGNRRRLAGALLNFGTLRRQEHDDQHALESLDESLKVNREIHDRRGEADVLAELARLERDRGDLARAHERAGETLAVLESLRLTVASPNLRASFFAAARDVQEMDIALLMRLDAEHPGKGFGAAALLASERSKARSLLEALGESSTEIRRGVAPALTDRERELEQLIFAKAERQTRLLNGKSTAAEAASVARELNSLTAELEDVQSRIRQSSPQYAALTQPLPLDLKQIQDRVLDADTTLLEFSLGADKSFLWAVTKSSADILELPSRQVVEAAARRVYELLTARNRNLANETPDARARRIRESDAAYLAAASNVSRMLLGPAARQIQNKRLLIVADGALQYLPFGSLPEPAADAVAGSKPSPLIVNHEIVAAPSASVVAIIRQESAGRKTAEKALALLADPVFSAGDARVVSTKAVATTARGAASGELDPGTREFVRLRFSRKEAEDIARLAPPDATLKALDFDASRDTVLQSNLGQYRIVHFATHSVLNNEHPELSGVVLSRVDREGRPRNGFLRLYDIYNLRLGSELVVLSACETALGGEIKGEGLIGLTRGFLYAGAPRVVATLWEIDDRTTAELMQRFYAAMLVRAERPAAALRSAQTELWKTKGWDNPYYWAAFTLQGEWR